MLRAERRARQVMAAPPAPPAAWRMRHGCAAGTARGLPDFAEMRNGEIAEAFEELASLYELDGAVVYRVVAYRNAAKAIREAGVSVEELAKQGRAEELAGVGKTIAEKIDALLDTGSIPSAEKLKQRIPPGLVEITRIRSEERRVGKEDRQRWAEQH